MPPIGKALIVYSIKVCQAKESGEFRPANTIIDREQNVPTGREPVMNLTGPWRGNATELNQQTKKQRQNFNALIYI